MHILGHFKTITHHKLLVMKHCFKVGLYYQGIMHDMSKYAPSEFLVGAKYYTGTCSPNAEERKELGYSTAWLHHKGRNRHHLEYWLDYGNSELGMVGHPMPTKYMVELCMDRIAACKVYHGKDYTDADPLEYLKNSRDSRMMHDKTRAQVVEILTMLRDKGEEETFRYIRDVVLKAPVKLYANAAKPEAPPEEKDRLPLEKDQLTSLAGEIQTPFYLYEEDMIRQRAREVREAFSWNSGFKQFFPVKATPTAGILKLLKKEGQGVVCSSGTEMLLAKNCGFTPEEILFLPNYPRKDDLSLAAEVGGIPILDGGAYLDAFQEAGLIGELMGLRLKPEEYFFFGEKVISSAEMKFGMTIPEAKRIALRLKELGVKKLMLHAYLSGNSCSPGYYEALTRFLMDAAMQITPILQVDVINISGGLGIPYQPGDKPLDLGYIGQTVESVFRSTGNGREIGLYTELGRYITGPAGSLITTVTGVKRAGRNYAGVDASAADLMRPMLYGAYHHITAVGKPDGTAREKWDVVGSVAENTDKFAENRLLPELHKGDILVIADAGAHGHSMGYNYGGRLRCGEYLLRQDGTVSCIRRAETPEDLLSTQVL